MLKHFVAVTAILTMMPIAAHASIDDNWLESYNRMMFDFNMKMDEYLLKPVAKGYRAITTQDVRNRVTSFISNVNEPVSSINHTLQGGIAQALTSVARFAVNTTLGLGGMFDVAEGWGLKKNSVGFDETMAHYCVPDGPFIMMPFFGPFTLRSGAGYAVDSVSSPVYIASLNDANYAAKISYGYTGASAINSRERALDLLDDLQKNSVDFYSTMRSAYLQNRQKMNLSCQPANSAPSYDFDFDDEDFGD